MSPREPATADDKTADPNAEHHSSPQHHWDKSGKLWKRDNPERNGRGDEAEGSQVTGTDEDYSGAMGDAGTQRR